MSDIIKIACYRTGPDWPQQTSADLATAIVQPAALTGMRLLTFFQQIIAAGGVQAELAPLYERGQFIVNLEENLTNGDLAGVQTLASLAADLVTMSETTTDAIDAVIAANSLRLVDVVAMELGETAPETVSEADVDEALGR